MPYLRKKKKRKERRKKKKERKRKIIEVYLTFSSLKIELVVVWQTTAFV